ncbi:MAG: DUF4893 domain-containing protein [Bacteroides sp.]|nr:DUF4893 domain-containing protein [Bacteroides sp.]
MNFRFLMSALIAYSSMTVPSAHAEARNLVGAWRGPKDLVIDVCDDGRNQQYVCSCGIFRTCGWVNLSTTFSNDSIIIVSEEIGHPFEGRFKIVSTDRLEGVLTMGNVGDEWFYNDSCELIRQKPEMPDNLNHALEGTILPADYGVLSLDRVMAQQALQAVTPDSYGYAEKREVEKLLNAKTYPLTPKEMTGFKRVRSIQIDGRDGIFSYPYFSCRFKEIDGKIFFEKTKGSQRKSGFLYENSPESLIFLGGWSVNDEPQTAYGSENSVAGTVYKIGADKAIMIFPSEQSRVEIYELVK